MDFLSDFLMFRNSLSEQLVFHITLESPLLCELSLHFASPARGNEVWITTYILVNWGTELLQERFRKLSSS